MPLSPLARSTLSTDAVEAAEPRKRSERVGGTSARNSASVFWVAFIVLLQRRCGRPGSQRSVLRAASESSSRQRLVTTAGVTSESAFPPLERVECRAGSRCVLIGLALHAALPGM
jgi:hypothetical protein